MSHIKEALMLTRETLMFLPLVPFCFIPVYSDIKDSPGRLFAKVAAACTGMVTVMFLVYLIWPGETGGVVNTGICVAGFFYLYQREVALERSRLWFVFLTACLIGSFSYLFYHLVDIFLYPEATIEMMPGLYSLILQIVFELVLILLLFYPTKKYIGWLVHNFPEERVWRSVWVFPAGICVFAYYFIPYDNKNMLVGRFLQMYAAVILVLLAMVFFIYVLFYKMAYSVMDKQKILLKAGYLEMEAEQYHRLLSHVQETGRLRHDFRHQITVIAEMLKSGEYEELEKYLEKYTSGISGTAVRYCTSSAVNAVLNHYEMLCRESGIQVHFSIRLGEQVTVEDIDFCVLLGNLLENAVDECRKQPEEQRWIRLRAGQTGEHVIALQIENPCRSRFRKHEGRYLSDKHEGDGQGLKSAEMIAEKYQGFMEADCRERVFTVRVLLYF